MVINETVIQAIEDATLDQFDGVGFIGFSDDGSSELPSADVLTGEFLRKALEATDKDLIAGTYEWEGLLGLTEANGETLQKFGLFLALTGDNLQLSKLLDVAISKDSTREINVGYQITREVVDLT